MVEEARKKVSGCNWDCSKLTAKQVKALLLDLGVPFPSGKAKALYVAIANKTFENDSNRELVQQRLCCNRDVDGRDNLVIGLGQDSVNDGAFADKENDCFYYSDSVYDDDSTDDDNEDAVYDPDSTGYEKQ